MKISNKIIATVGIVVLVILLVFYPLQDWWMTGNFDNIERQKVESEFNHTANGINFDLVSLQNVARDYADWDDTYNFVQNYNEQYVMSNLVKGTFVNQRLSMIVIANSTGDILYARGYDQGRDDLTEIPEGVAARLVAGSPLLPSPGNSTQGLVALPEGFMMVSAVPVLKSDFTGPPTGTLIMGRYLDRREIDIIESISGTQMSLQPWDAGPGPASDDSLQIRSAGNDSVTGQRVINDIYGQPAAVLSISLPRPFLTEEQAGQRFNIIALIGASVLGCLIFLVLIEWMVLSPMRKLSDSVARIGRDQDLAQRVPVAGDDELSLLAGTINRTLDALEGSRQKLQDKEQQFRNLVENINDVVWEADADLKLTYVSPQAREVMGHEPSAILGRSPFDLVDPGERVHLRSTIHDMIARKDSFALVEFAIARPDGGRAEIEVGGNPIRDAAGDIVGYRGIARDIGERRRAEMALRESEERLRLCAATARFGTFDWDLTNDRHLWSPETYEIYGITQETRLTREIVMDLIYPGDRKDETFAAALDPAGPGGYTMEYRIIRASDGAVRWVFVMARVFFSGEGADCRAVRVLGALQDITDRKQAEESMMGSLKEKEVLLKEIHHRVKNNLQIISSLLSLQSEKINNENPAQTFRESQDRIRSMALIHEKLYRSKDISRIDFAEYVRSLTAYLSRSYVTRPGIEIAIDIRDVSLDIDTAIPCGLIINELVSNSLKYAFPGGRAGEVRIGLARCDNEYTLTVGDNGIGLSADLDFRNTASLGLQLVNTLVGQLDGTIELDPSGGTMFRITFAEIKPRFTPPGYPEG
jgi:PAS domain S-box-containing protein